MALQWLSAAEAAEHDSAVYRLLTEKHKVGQNSAAAMINDLRNFRGELPKDFPAGWVPPKGKR